MSPPDGWRNYEFNFPGYIEAVETQQRLLAEATAASQRLREANTIVEEFEEKMRTAMENALAEARVLAKGAASTDASV